MASLSAERISREFLKLLAAPDPRAAVDLMDRTGVLAVVLPAPADLARFAALVGIAGDAVLRLAALLPDDPAAAIQVATGLRLSNADRDRLAAALAPTPGLTSTMGPRDIRECVYRLRPAVFRDRARLAWARDGEGAARWRDVLAQGDGWTAPVFPLDGQDVLAAGVPKGPLVGKALGEVEAWWIASDFAPDRPSLLQKLASVVQGTAS